MADGTSSDYRAERKQQLKKEEKEKEENARSPRAKISKMTTSAEEWVEFAENHPDDFLSIIIDDFSSLRLVQALFVTASVGLVRTSMGKNHHGAHQHSLNDLYLQRMGFVAALSVFCNLFGIILAIFVSVQCRGMREMKANGKHVVSIMPRLFTLFYITMASFMLGMILMGLAVCILLFTTESWEMSMLIAVIAGAIFVLLIVLLTKFSFGSSLATHSLTLAFETVQHSGQDLEGAAAGIYGAVGSTVRSTVTRMGTGKDESDKDDVGKDDDEEKAKTADPEMKKGPKASSSPESAAEDAEESGKAAASKESSEKPDEKPKEDGKAK